MQESKIGMVSDNTTNVSKKTAVAAVDLGVGILKEMVGASITLSSDLEAGELIAASLSNDLKL